MKAARILPYLLAGATLILLGSNAIPTAHRKHMLLEKKWRLERDLAQERKRHDDLLAQREALLHDPFYLQRIALETWRAMPPGAVRWDPEAPRSSD